MWGNNDSNVCSCKHIMERRKGNHLLTMARDGADLRTRRGLLTATDTERGSLIVSTFCLFLFNICLTDMHYFCIWSCDLEKIILEGWAGDMKGGNLGDFKCLWRPWQLTQVQRESDRRRNRWEAALRKRPDDQCELGAWNLTPALFCRLVPELGKKKGHYSITCSTLSLLGQNSVWAPAEHLCAHRLSVPAAVSVLIPHWRVCTRDLVRAAASLLTAPWAFLCSSVPFRRWHHYISLLLGDWQTALWLFPQKPECLSSLAWSITVGCSLQDPSKNRFCFHYDV